MFYKCRDLVFAIRAQICWTVKKTVRLAGYRPLIFSWIGAHSKVHKVHCTLVEGASCLVLGKVPVRNFVSTVLAGGHGGKYTNETTISAVYVTVKTPGKYLRVLTVVKRYLGVAVPQPRKASINEGQKGKIKGDHVQ